MDIGLLLVHAVVGTFLVAHGVQHALGRLGGGGLSGTGAWFESLGLRHGRPLAALAGGTELVGGALLAVGLLTPFAAAGLAATMLVAALTDHRGRFWIYLNGAEYVLTNAVVVTGLAFAGAGRFSLDRLVGWDVAGWQWGVGAAGAALVGAAAVLALFRERTAREAEPQAA